MKKVTKPVPAAVAAINAEVEAEVAAATPPKSKVKKIDWSRPYGTIHGESKGSYEQEGKLFDIDGLEVTE